MQTSHADRHSRGVKLKPVAILAGKLGSHLINRYNFMNNEKSTMNMKNLLIKLTEYFVNVASKSYYLTEVARRMVQVYDNDCNADIEKNGEKKLQQLIASSSDADSIFVDVGANVGDWSAALIGGGMQVV